MEKEDWKYILVNGCANILQVKNPTFEKGVLTSIDDLKPFNLKDSGGNPIEPTLADANGEKRKIYNEFFKKPFKNLLVFSGAGSSMDVGGLSMGELWSKAEEKYKSGDIDGFQIIRNAVNFNSESKDLEALLSQIDGYSKFVNDKEIMRVMLK